MRFWALQLICVPSYFYQLQQKLLHPPDGKYSHICTVSRQIWGRKITKKFGRVLRGGQAQYEVSL